MQYFKGYLPLEDELLEDSERPMLLTFAVVCDIDVVFGMCGDADRLKGLGVPAAKETKFRSNYIEVIEI